MRPRTKYERRYLRRGGCVACGRPRAKRTHRGRPSRRFCRKHLLRNNRYQRRYRVRQGRTR